MTNFPVTLDLFSKPMRVGGNAIFISSHVIRREGTTENGGAASRSVSLGVTGSQYFHQELRNFRLHGHIFKDV